MTGTTNATTGATLTPSQIKHPEATIPTGKANWTWGGVLRTVSKALGTFLSSIANIFKATTNIFAGLCGQQDTSGTSMKDRDVEPHNGGDTHIQLAAMRQHGGETTTSSQNNTKLSATTIKNRMAGIHR